MTIKEFTVDGHRWIRGEAPTDENQKNYTAMARIKHNLSVVPEWEMCVLGFLGNSGGLEPADMNGVNFPGELDQPNIFPSGMFLYEDMISWINDNSNITDSTRMKKLRAEFKKLKIKVKFKNMGGS